jgi:hypothetical protein
MHCFQQDIDYDAAARALLIEEHSNKEHAVEEQDKADNTETEMKIVSQQPPNKHLM